MNELMLRFNKQPCLGIEEANLSLFADNVVFADNVFTPRETTETLLEAIGTFRIIFVFKINT